MPMQKETHIHSEFEAKMRVDTRTGRKKVQEINQEVSELSTDRDFVEVDYKFDTQGDMAELIVSLYSENSFNRSTHHEAIEMMVGAVLDAQFNEYQIETALTEVEQEVEEE